VGGLDRACVRVMRARIHGGEAGARRREESIRARSVDASAPARCRIAAASARPAAGDATPALPWSAWSPAGVGRAGVDGACAGWRKRL
jgi:hypothetical protein